MTTGFDALLTLPKAEAIKRLGEVKDMPAIVRLGITAGLMQMPEANYEFYGFWLHEAIAALQETPRGQKVLSAFGIRQPAAARQD
jgi:hypothetical protein